MATVALAGTVITLDTSGLFALLNRRDSDHERARRALEQASRPYLIPLAIMAEITYLVEKRIPSTLDLFLHDLEVGAFTADCGDGDLPRIRQLVDRYADLSLGFSDAAVIACGERSGGAVLTLDVPDFGTVAREGTIRLLP